MIRPSRLLVASGLLLSAFAVSARAEMNWAGPYAGANLGYAWGTASTAINSDGDDNGTFGSGAGSNGEPPDGGFNHNLRRALYGVQAGYYGAVWNNFYGGLEATYDKGNIAADSVDDIPAANGRVTRKTKVNTLVTLAPQAGYAWDRTMFHAKGGLAVGRVFSEANNQTQGISFGKNVVNFGWTFGVGADYALTDHVTAGLSFDYYDLGTTEVGGNEQPDNTYPVAWRVHPVLRALNARVSYKF